MTVESYIMVRTQHDENGSQPRPADLAPYTSLNWEDATGRPVPIYNTDPQTVILRARMSNADALAMSTDNKLWMIESRRYDAEGTEQDNNKDDPYTAEERATHITQLANHTDFDADTIAAWWSPDKTRRQVALKLRNYLKTLEAG